MNFAAYQTIYQQHELYFKQEEENYGEKFNSFYKPLLNNSGETIGCINIPDINYKKSLRQDLSGFIATLININAFIFLLAAAIAFIVTNRITSSFTLIKNKMKAINWQSQNDEIEWKRNDEIGALDNGTGIPEALQPKIFALNFTTKNSGTGLGLAICKGIVENANGNIWFETGNTGTTFFVELPLIENVQQ
ncbi:unnamed protein product [Rotaria sp. Silwood1]|nr:unnamed protein product [Rotaria sp. Silwood1]CAF4659490.1 unnamed protein product [Rotaria sp. Silwood1]